MTMNIKQELEKTLPRNMTLTEEEKASIRSRTRQKKQRKFRLKPAMGVLVAIVVAAFVLPTINKESPVQTSAPLVLTEQQKRDYYEQYANIIEQEMQHKSGIDIELVPFEAFKDSDWVTIEKFENRFKGAAEHHLEIERERIAALGPNREKAVTNADGETTKKTYIYFSDILKTIEVTAQFDTEYDAKAGHHVFVGVENMSSHLKGTFGDWAQTAQQVELINNGQTYVIHIEGIFRTGEESGIEKAFTLEFHCDEAGEVY
ncbi:MAG: hypothetical protein ABS951_06975 [Solibacillus sp.]